MNFKKLENCPVFNQGGAMLITIYIDTYWCFILIIFCMLCYKFFFFSWEVKTLDHKAEDFKMIYDFFFFKLAMWNFIIFNRKWV